ncbi:hypothetical protein [Paenibacillus lautus]|uniref:hypothetical protein n=1 Tax=Paenibacillus lautus TaxID=1401 RepID=UPI001C7CB3DC|nr:hypothetical protein [Paenibacillus lautus]MBX4152319.1 hypothetical protein [Paenibacillus lautus]
MGKKVIIARLRPGKDDDIRQALQELPPYHDESDILRAALRQFLFGHREIQPLLVRNQDSSTHDMQTEYSEDFSLSQIKTDNDDLDEKLDDFIKE